MTDRRETLLELEDGREFIYDDAEQKYVELETPLRVPDVVLADVDSFIDWCLFAEQIVTIHELAVGLITVSRSGRLSAKMPFRPQKHEQHWAVTSAAPMLVPGPEHQAHSWTAVENWLVMVGANRLVVTPDKEGPSVQVARLRMPFGDPGFTTEIQYSVERLESGHYEVSRDRFDGASEAFVEWTRKKLIGKSGVSPKRWLIVTVP